MRRIVTKEEKDKKETRNKLIMGIVMVAILVLSTAGYAIFSREDNSSGSVEKKNYNGIEFEKMGNGLWVFKLNGASFYTNFEPKETENISVPFVTYQQYSGKNLYIVSEDNRAKAEIYQNLGRVVSRIQDACFMGENCTSDLPEKNCSSNMILIKENKNIEIKEEENCIFINAPSSEILRATDAYIFKVLGVRSY